MRKRSKCETKTSTQVVPSGSRNHLQDHTCGSREKNLRFVIAILQGTTGCHNPRPPQVVPKPFKSQATRRTSNRKEKHHGKHPLTHMEGALRKLRTQQADLPQPPTTLLPTLHPLKARNHEENQNHARSGRRHHRHPRQRRSRRAVSPVQMPSPHAARRIRTETGIGRLG